MTQHTCPICDSYNLLVYEKTAFELNGGDFYCHSVKMHDDDAEVQCTHCDWKGTVSNFTNEPSK